MFGDGQEVEEAEDVDVDGCRAALEEGKLSLLRAGEARKERVGLAQCGHPPC